jgi:glycosyltransferase involved in cell wall biosynthesis
MTGDSLVTVGMPVFNGEPYVRKAIESILEQTYANLEIIVSDNASSDATGAIALEYARRDSRIRYIRRDLNRGSTWNFDSVLQAARGRYFMWAAVDDWRSPGSIAAMFRALQADAETVTAGTPYVLVGPDGVQVGDRLVPIDVTSESAWERVRAIVPHRLAGAYTYALHRSEVIRRYRFKPFAFIPHTAKGMEHSFLCYLAAAGKMVTVSDGSRPESALVHVVARTQILARTPYAVFRGSGSLRVAARALALEAGAQGRQIAELAPRWLRKILTTRSAGQGGRGH